MDTTGGILVVDDDSAVRSFFAQVLRMHGYEVWEASAGREGLRIAQVKRPGLVLLDVRLPDVDGIEVCRQIKADSTLADVFVVMISGEATSSLQKVDGLETGADDYLSKPVEVHEFIARIRTIMRLRHTTAALRASEQHYRRLLEILPDGVSVVDREGRVQAANAQAAAMLAYDSPSELLGRSVFDLTLPECHERARTDIAATLQTGLLRNAEYLVLDKEGRTVPVELSAAALTDGKGQPPALVVVARDITARKQAESRIGELLRILDQAQDAILVRDMDGRIEYFNQGAERLLGWCADEVRGRLSRELFYADPSEFETARAKLLQSGEWVGELHWHTKDGKPLTLHSRWNLAKTDSGGGVRVVCINTDISRWKQAEAHLRLQSAALESAANAIVITDRAGNLTWANPAFTRLTGYYVEEVAGRNLRFLKSGRHTPSFYRELWQTILAGRVWRSEMVNRRKDGSLYTEENIITPVKDERGEISHFIAVKQDVTERIWAERQLEIQRDFGVYLSTVNEPKAAAERILEIALESEGIDCGGVYMVDAETGALELAAHQGFSKDFVRNAARFDPDSIQVRLANAGQGLYWRHGEPMADVARHVPKEGLQAVRAIPIFHDGRVVAVLNVGSHLNRVIPSRACRAVEAVAAHAGGAIARIRAEQLLRSQRQLLEKTLHALQAAVLVLDADATTILECNPAATVIFGYKREELIGRTAAALHVDVASRTAFEERLRAAVRRKGLLKDFEFRMKRRDGTVFSSEHCVTPIRDTKGRIASWVSIVRDTSRQKRAEEELRHLTRRIIEVQEIERQRVARDLHDGVNQVIASAGMRLRGMEAGVAGLGPASREKLARCHDLLVQALEENRRIAHNLRPSDLDELGLSAACRNLCRKLQSRTSLVIKCDVSRAGERLPPAIELNLFRVMQEALTNVEKHARAKTVHLRLVRRNGLVELRIQDDGSGFGRRLKNAANKKRRGAGLANMRERAVSLGGECHVESAPGQGTTITVRVPSNGK